MSDESNKKYVRKDMCDERFGRIMDKLTSIEEKISNHVIHIEERISKLENEEKQGGRDIKQTILSIVSGGIIVLIGYIFGKLI